MFCPAARRIELIWSHSSVGELRQNLQLTAEGFDDLPQRRNLHIGLLLQLRQTGLLHSQDFSKLLLAVAGQLPNFAKQAMESYDMIKAFTGYDFYDFMLRNKEDFRTPVLKLLRSLQQ